MRTGLGRGLDVLLGERPAVPSTGAATNGITEIPLEKVAPNPQQPRQKFDADDLARLAGSIKRHGVLQPIVVSRRGDGYELVAGHRRMLASRLAGRTSIPAIVRDDVNERLELALIENVMRADLNALEEARAYRMLAEAYGLTQQQIGERVGKDQTTVAHRLRLLDAPQILQDALVDGKITDGHVRALMGVGLSQLPAALSRVMRDELSVRATEELARQLGRGKARSNGRVVEVDADTKARTNDLRAALGTKVEIQRGRKGGRIAIEFYSNDDFERLYELLMSATK